VEQSGADIKGGGVGLVGKARCSNNLPVARLWSAALRFPWQRARTHQLERLPTFADDPRQLRVLIDDRFAECDFVNVDSVYEYRSF
jgi:hypothetical protein